MSFFLLELISILFFLAFWVGLAYLAYLVIFKKDPITSKEINEVKFPKSLGWTVGIIIIAYNLFLYTVLKTFDSIPGIGWGLFIVISMVALLMAFPKKKRTPLTYSLAILAGLAGLSGAWMANEFTQEMNLTVIYLSNLGLLLLFILPSIKWDGLWILKSLWDSFFQSIRHLLVLFKLTFQTKNMKGAEAIRILKTIFITFIVLLIFANLLGNADPIFEELIHDIKEEAAERTFLSLILGASLIFGLTLQVKRKEEDTQLKFFTFHDIMIPMIGIELLFAVFLFIQAKYLFGSHEAIVNFDITYSEYVRKGFIELLSTTLLGGFMAYFVIIKTKTLNKLSQINLLKGLNVILVLELFALLASAFKRDLLYIETYGLTRVRLIGGIFLVWLAATLMMLLITNLKKKHQEKHLFLGVFFISIVSFIYMNTVNMDHQIATYEHPTAETDYFYISNLSVDAIHGWTQIIGGMKTELNTLIPIAELNEEELQRVSDIYLSIQNIKEKRTHLEDKFGPEEAFQLKFEDEDGDYWEEYNDYNEWTRERLEAERSWSTWNWKEQKAYETISANTETFYETLECMETQIINHQIAHLTDLDNLRWNRHNDYEYPFMNTYYRYTPNLSSTIYDALEDADMLWKENDEYGKGWIDLENLTEEQEIILTKLQTLHTPQVCN